VKPPKDWSSGHTPAVKLAKDWKEKLGQISKFKPVKLPPMKISKDASSALAPVKLAKDWKERSGQSSQSTLGKLPPLKLSKDASSSPVKFSRDVSSSPVKLAKDWKNRLACLLSQSMSRFPRTPLLHLPLSNWPRIGRKGLRSQPMTGFLL